MAFAVKTFESDFVELGHSSIKSLRCFIDLDKSKLTGDEKPLAGRVEFVDVDGCVKRLMLVAQEYRLLKLGILSFGDEDGFCRVGSLYNESSLGNSGSCLSLSAGIVRIHDS